MLILLICNSSANLTKEFVFLLYVINIFSKYAWIIPLKDKKETTISNAFQIILYEINFKPNKIWVIKDKKINTTVYIIEP